ncbi:MAG TPA: hypothetical protein VM513_36190 [Kofleriaceae bacterium]|nr:hypothetical protein [Kofleriaceae bacterium]
MSGENHSEKLHRNDRDHAFRPDLLSEEFEQQRRVDADHEGGEHEADAQTNANAVTRMARLALGDANGSSNRLVPSAPSTQGAEFAMQLFREVNGDREEGEHEDEESHEEAKDTGASDERANPGEALDAAMGEHANGEHASGEHANGVGANVAMQVLGAVIGGQTNDGGTANGGGANVAMQVLGAVTGAPIGGQTTGGGTPANVAMQVLGAVTGAPTGGQTIGGGGQSANVGDNPAMQVLGALTGGQAANDGSANVAEHVLGAVMGNGAADTSQAPAELQFHDVDPTASADHETAHDATNEQGHGHGAVATAAVLGGALGAAIGQKRGGGRGLLFGALGAFGAGAIVRGIIDHREQVGTDADGDGRPDARPAQPTQVGRAAEVRPAVQTRDANTAQPQAQAPAQPSNAMLPASANDGGMAGATPPMDHGEPVFLNPFRNGLRVGPADDVYEREADQLADQVMGAQAADRELGGEEQHEQELDQHVADAQQDLHAAQQQRRQIQQTAARQQRAVQQRTTSQAARVTSGGQQHVARRRSSGQARLAAARTRGDQAQHQQRQAAQARRVQKAKSIAEVKAKLEAAFKTKSEALKAEVEKQRTELKTKLAGEKQKLADEIKAQDAALAAEVAKRNADLEKKIADKKKASEAQNKAELDKAEAASRGEQHRVTTAGDSEAARIEDKGKSEAASAKRAGSREAASIRSRGRQQAASLRKEEGGEQRAAAASRKATADARAAEARGAREAEAKLANAHRMADAAKAKAAAQVNGLKARLETTRAQLQRQLADAIAQADAERRTMLAEVQRFIETSKREMAAKTDESNVRLNQLEKDSLARIDAVETQTRRKIQQQHDDLVIKLDGPTAARELAKLDAEANKVCEQIEKAVTDAQQSVRQEVADSQAAAERQTQQRIAAVRAEGKKALDRITAKAADSERKIDAVIAQLQRRNKAALEAQDRETKERAGTAVAELHAQGDKSVADLEKSAAQLAQERAAEEAAAAAAKAAEEKQKADAEKARLAEEKRQQEAAAAAERAKKEELQRRTAGAADELFQAMDGWGTDEKKVMRALQGKSPEEMAAIKAAYQARTGRSLESDLTSEMGGNDLKEAKALLSQDPVQSRVAALQSAMQGWGTDERKVRETLASMTDPALRARVIAEYEKQTGEKLSKVLANEGMASEGVRPEDFRVTPQGPVLDEDRVRQLAQSKDVKAAASAILAATDRWGTDERAIQEALKGKTPEEIAAIKEAFRQHSNGQNLDDVLEDELAGEELKEAKALLSTDPVQIAVAQLHNASAGFGTDTQKLHDTLKGITDPELRRQVTREYERQTGQKLDDMLEGELSGFDKDKARAYAKGDQAEIAAVEADAAMHGGFLTDMADGVADTFGADRKAVRDAVGGAVISVGVPFAGPMMAAFGVTPGTDFGTDNTALYAALESAKTQQERDALIAAYRTRTGRDLMADVNADLEGKEEDVARFIMAGDRAGAEAAKMAAAAQGLGTDRAAIYQALEGAQSKEERDAIIARYNELYGKSGQTFEQMIDSELDELDREKAKQLATQGRMSDGFALYYAMNEGFLGIGTDDDLLKQRLQGKDKEEIARIQLEYAAAAEEFGKRPGADLVADVQGETSGRAGHELRQALKGNPTTIEEMRQRLAEDYAFERTQSGWVGTAAMWIMSPAAAATGVKSTDIANGLTDLWSGSGQRLDQTHREIEEKYLAIRNDPRFKDYDKFPPGSPEREAMDRAMMAELRGVSDWQEGDLKAFQEAKDATADVASTAVTVAVGAVITVASGGTAAPAVVALISGLAGVSTKMLIRGASMSNEEIVQETAAVIAEAAASGIVHIEKINKLTETVGQMAGGNNRLIAKIVSEALEEALESGSEEVINAMLDPSLYKGDLVDWAKGVSQRTGKAMFTGALAGSVASAAGDPLPQSDRWYGRASAAAASQAIGSVVTTAIDPTTYQGSQEEKFVRFGRNVGEAALRGARDSLGGGRGDALGSDYNNASHGANADTNTNPNTNVNTRINAPSTTRADTTTASPSVNTATPSTTVDTTTAVDSNVAATVDSNTASAVDANAAIAVNTNPPAAVNANTAATVDANPAAPNATAVVDTRTEVASDQHVTGPINVANDADIVTARTGQPLVGDTSFNVDANRDGVQDAARVGVDGSTIPNQIPRLHGLDPAQAAAEARFAAAYERDPQALVRRGEPRLGGGLRGIEAM